VLTIGRYLHTWLIVPVLAIGTTAFGRWQIVSTGTRAPRHWARGAAPFIANARASRATT
jgi:hypothetical protein